VKVSDAVGRLLVERGVRQVFGLIGSGNFDITLAMVEAGASFASSRHEGGAITMGLSKRLPRRTASIHGLYRSRSTSCCRSPVRWSSTPATSWAGRRCTWRLPPRGFIFNQSYQSIGLGLATAIGAAVARPERLTVAALGDGGLLTSLPELGTVARLGLNLLVVVYNDAAYGAEVHHFGPLGRPTDIVRFPETDFAAIARACGLEGLTVRSSEDLAPASAWLAGDRGKALLIDAKVVPTVVAEWLEEAFKGH
jgi:thiamine pyrophosphate-dependent acetolactate synthase large subunit-like protein